MMGARLRQNNPTAGPGVALVKPGQINFRFTEMASPRAQVPRERGLIFVTREGG